MVNEDILTGLKNAIDHGDNLESAKQIMINSGYNAKEVEEASRFVGGGIIANNQPKPQEVLAMPNQKSSLVSKFKNNSSLSSPKRLNSQQFQSQNTSQQIKQAINPGNRQMNYNQMPLKKLEIPMLSSPTQQQLKKITPKKYGHGKEIILLVILLSLIGLLVTTILLKSTILGWFS